MESREFKDIGVGSFGDAFMAACGEAHREPLSETAAEIYLAALRGDDHAALAVIGQSLPERVPGLVFQVVQQLHEDWQGDRISLNRVTAAFVVIRKVCDRFAVRDTKAEPHGLYVGYCAICMAAFEEHTFGPQILSDSLRRSGWKVDFFRDIPESPIIDLVARSHVDVVGFSIGQDRAFLGLSDLISEIRARSQNPGVSVVVGGRALSGSQHRFGFLGADAIAKDFEDAVSVFAKIARGLHAGKVA